MKKFLLLLSLIAALVMLPACGSSESKQGEETNTTEGQSAPEKELKTWEYTTEKDEMTGEESVIAKLDCDKAVTVDNFTLNMYILVKDDNTAELHMSNWIKSDKGYNAFAGTYSTDFEVKFDDNEIEKIKVGRKNSENVKMVKIKNAADFISKCKSAKKIVIRTADLNVFGIITFAFTVDEPLKAN